MTHKTVPVEPTPEQIDTHLDAVLRASGSALKHYSLPNSLQKMRAAMRDAMVSSAPPSPVTELEAMLYEALRAFRDGGPEGGTDFNGWHQSYEEPCRLARAALAAFNAKKEVK